MSGKINKDYLRPYIMDQLLCNGTIVIPSSLEIIINLDLNLYVKLKKEKLLKSILYIIYNLYQY